MCLSFIPLIGIFRSFLLRLFTSCLFNRYVDIILSYPCHIWFETWNCFAARFNCFLINKKTVMELKAIVQLCSVRGNQWYPRTDVEKSTYWQWQRYLLCQLVMYSGTLPWSNMAKFTKVLHFANANRKHMKWVQGTNGHKVAHFLTKDVTQTFRQRCLTQRNGWRHTQYVQVTFPHRNMF